MALGDFWGFQAGWWSWASAVATSASFAALFADYVKALDPDLTALQHWILALMLIWAMHWVNVKGIEMVGNSAVLMSALLLVPFVLMIGLGLSHWNHNPFVPFTAPGKGVLGFATALSTAIWLYSGYEKLSCAAEEVENPQRTFPPALFSAATLAMLSYLLPTLCALAMLGNWQDWGSGYFPSAGGKMAGPWLQNLTVAAGLISNALLLNVTMMAASRTLLTMSEDKLAPPGLARHNPTTGTPTAALTVGSILLSALALIDFNQLLVIYAWFTMTATMLIYINVFRLRRLHPEVPRTFSVPGGTGGLVLLALPTLFLAILALESTVVTDGHFDLRQVVVGLMATLSGPLLYVLLRRGRPRPEEHSRDAALERVT
jgi:amino acid transporter